MARISAGLLMYREREGQLEVLLVHPGGPYWQHKDEGAWTIPKGEIEPGEDELTAAIREFEEETGIRPHSPFHSLGQIRQKAGKIIHAWAFEGTCDPDNIRSNQFTMQWPPNSGQFVSFPEVDRASFFTIDDAQRKIHPAQAALLDRLVELRSRARAAGESRH